MLEVGKGFRVAVAGLLIKQLGLEQIAHRRRAGTVVVAVQSQVFFGLLDTAAGNLYQLTGFVGIVPRLLQANAEQLSVILELLLSLLQLNLLVLHGMRATPPVADGHAQRCKHHSERAVVVQKIMVVVASSHGHAR